MERAYELFLSKYKKRGIENHHINDIHIGLNRNIGVKSNS